MQNSKAFKNQDHLFHIVNFDDQIAILRKLEVSNNFHSAPLLFITYKLLILFIREIKNGKRIIDFSKIGLHDINDPASTSLTMKLYLNHG